MSKRKFEVSKRRCATFHIDFVLLNIKPKRRFDQRVCSKSIFHLQNRGMTEIYYYINLKSVEENSQFSTSCCKQSGLQQNTTETSLLK